MVRSMSRHGAGVLNGTESLNGNSTLRAPSLLLWAAEIPRGAWGLASQLWSQATLAAGPKGDGRPILILPGLVNSDRSNLLMRRYLRRLGYRVEGWGLGPNLGARCRRRGREADRTGPRTS
jgi:hypothetical protein